MTLLQTTNVVVLLWLFLLFVSLWFSCYLWPQCVWLGLKSYFIWRSWRLSVSLCWWMCCVVILTIHNFYVLLPRILELVLPRLCQSLSFLTLWRAWLFNWQRIRRLIWSSMQDNGWTSSYLERKRLEGFPCAAAHQTWAWKVQWTWLWSSPLGHQHIGYTHSAGWEIG